MKRKLSVLPISVLLALTVTAFSSTAFAVDGVVEVNQACAVNAGCFTGDTAGYPVTINGSAGRSYRLTSDLIVPDENTHGIQVSAPSISIDLNGFEIVRSGCEGATSNCTPVSGTGSGVFVSNNIYHGVSVRNGSITGMGNHGAFLFGHQAEAKGLRVRWNRDRGLLAGIASIVSGNTAYSNGDQGISAGGGSTISNNTAYGNGTVGIHAGDGSTVSGNTAYSNGGDGINAGSGSTVSGNTAFTNGDDGFWVGAGSTVSGNAAYDNDSHGIQAVSGVVQRNTVSSNDGFGLVLGPSAAYRENVITANPGGTVDGGFNMGSNYCNGNDTCP